MSFTREIDRQKYKMKRKGMEDLTQYIDHTHSFLTAEKTLGCLLPS